IPDLAATIAKHSRVLSPSATLLFRRLRCGRLRRRRQDSVEAQVNGLRAVVVEPTVAESNQRTGAAGGPVAEQDQGIAELGVIDASQGSGAEIEGGLERRHEFVFGVRLGEFYVRRGGG